MGWNFKNACRIGFIEKMVMVNIWRCEEVIWGPRRPKGYALSTGERGQA